MQIVGSLPHCKILRIPHLAELCVIIGPACPDHLDVNVDDPPADRPLLFSGFAPAREPHACLRGRERARLWHSGQIIPDCVDSVNEGNLTEILQVSP